MNEAVGMRALSITLSVAAVVAPTVASADSARVTLGVGAGLHQDKSAALDGQDSNQTLGMWGRIALTKRLSGQLELAKQETTFGCEMCTIGTTAQIRTTTALLVVDLADGGNWMPMLLVGAGLDRDTGSFPTSGRHIEGGFGIEYRANAGLSIGADIRMGGRTIDDDVMIAIVRPEDALQPGEYRSARLTVGVRF